MVNQYKICWGVIIIIAILIVLSAILYEWKSGFPCATKDNPKGKIQHFGSDKEYYYIKVIEMNPPFGLRGATYYLTDGEQRLDYNPVENVYCLYSGNVTFHDIDRDGKINSEDIFLVSKILYDGTIVNSSSELSLKFDPTGETITETNFQNESLYKPNVNLKPIQNWNTTWTEENNTISISNPPNNRITDRYLVIERFGVGKVKISVVINNDGNKTIKRLNLKFKDCEENIGETNITNFSGFSSKIANITWEIEKNIDVGNHTIEINIDPDDNIENVGLNATFNIEVIETYEVVCSFDISFIRILLTIMVISILSFKYRKKF